jgi:hypothetical protein
MLLLLLACVSTEEVPARPPEPVVAPPPAPPAAPPPPEFDSAVLPLDEGTLEAMRGVSWPEGCPTPLSQLVTVQVSWHDEQGGAHHDGELVVHRDAADVVVRAFEAAWDAGFPFTSIRPIRAFDGSDDASMEANNTSAFNCRKVKGTDTWSQHSTGRALDVNPKWNPWVKGDKVDPPSGRPWADRTAQHPGMLRADSAMTRAFLDAGWGWGGSWRSSKDYQHFSESGR